MDVFEMETSPLKKKLFITLCILVLSGLIVAFLLYQYSHTLHVNNNVVYEVGDKISYDISKYVTNDIVDEDDFSLNLKGVPIENDRITSVGEFEFKVKYKNVSKKGTMKVVDTVSPVVETQDLTIGLDEEYALDDFLKSCDDYSKPCEVSYKNEKDENISSKTGSYKIDIVISDQYKNKTVKTVNLNVKKNYSYENFKQSDLNISYIEPEHDDFKNVMIIKYEKAIDEHDLDHDEKYLELQDLLSDDLSVYLPKEYSNLSIVEQELITVYNKYDYILGFALRVKLSSGIYLYLTK